MRRNPLSGLATALLPASERAAQQGLLANAMTWFETTTADTASFAITESGVVEVAAMYKVDWEQTLVMHGLHPQYASPTYAEPSGG